MCGREQEQAQCHYEFGGQAFDDEWPNTIRQIEKKLRACRRSAIEHGFKALRVICEPSGGYQDKLLHTARRLGHLTAKFVAPPRLCFAARGFSLHAATRIAANDRHRLERLCRYVIRPPLASGRLTVVDSETLSFALKTPWSNGTTHLLLSPEELIEKLAALVPPPRLNLVRYHGVLAPNAADRKQIVPGPKQEACASGHGEPSTGRRRYRLSWSVCWAGYFRST